MTGGKEGEGAHTAGACCWGEAGGGLPAGGGAPAAEHVLYRQNHTLLPPPQENAGTKGWKYHFRKEMSGL